MQIVMPIIVRAGKARDKDLRKLRLGTGRMVEDMKLVVRMLEADSSFKKDGRVLMPVIAFYSLEGDLDELGNVDENPLLATS